MNLKPNITVVYYDITANTIMQVMNSNLSWTYFLVLKFLKSYLMAKELIKNLTIKKLLVWKMYQVSNFFLSWKKVNFYTVKDSRKDQLFISSMLKNKCKKKILATHIVDSLQAQIPRSLVVSYRVDHHIQQKQMLGIGILGCWCVCHQARQN